MISDPFGNYYGNGLQLGLAAAYPGTLARCEGEQLQNSLRWRNWHVPTAYERAKSRRNTACQWFATKWRTRASEIGVQAAARLMRKQGVPCDVCVSILATR